MPGENLNNTIFYDKFINDKCREIHELRCQFLRSEGEDNLSYLRRLLWGGHLPIFDACMVAGISEAEFHKARRWAMLVRAEYIDREVLSSGVGLPPMNPATDTKQESAPPLPPKRRQARLNSADPAMGSGNESHMPPSGNKAISKKHVRFNDVVSIAEACIDTRECIMPSRDVRKYRGSVDRSAKAKGYDWAEGYDDPADGPFVAPSVARKGNLLVHASAVHKDVPPAASHFLSSAEREVSLILTASQ